MIFNINLSFSNPTSLESIEYINEKLIKAKFHNNRHDEIKQIDKCSILYTSYFLITNKKVKDNEYYIKLKDMHFSIGNSSDLVYVNLTCTESKECIDKKFFSGINGDYRKGSQYHSTNKLKRTDFFFSDVYTDDAKRIVKALKHIKNLCLPSSNKKELF